MNNEPKPKNSTPDGRAAYLLLALVPIALGLIMPKAFTSLASTGITKDNFLLAGIYPVFCITAGIGVCGGFREGAWLARIAGIVIGLLLAFIDAGIVAFMGCCSGISQM